MSSSNCATELGDARSSEEFGERWQFLNIRSDTQVQFVDWIPHPILKVLESKKRVWQFFGAGHRVFRSRHHQKKPHFLPKNGRKMPFFGLKQRFWGLSGQL